MISTWGMILLIVAYMGIALAAACEHRWGRAIYYVGASVLSVGVLCMDWRGWRQELGL